jgi:hypothetical protein
MAKRRRRSRPKARPAAARLAAARAAAWRLLVGRPGARRARGPTARRNVVGVAIGVKSVAGRFVGRPCIVVLVERKVSRELVAPGDVIPATIGGVETDVVEAGRFRPLGGPAYPGPADPRKGGASVAYRSPSATCAAAGDCIAGTLGAVVSRDGDASGRYLLSNNHVLAGENARPVGWDIVQPSPRDQGPGSVVANLTDWIKLVATGTNVADCAIARVRDGVASSRDFMDPRIKLSGPSIQAKVGDVVHKVGRTSGYSVGYVSGVDASVLVDYAMGTLAFEGQVLLSPLGSGFAEEGDSGSLVVDYRTSRPSGLLFAASRSACAATPVSLVEALLGVKV